MSDLGDSLIRGAMEALEYAKGKKKGFAVHKVEIPSRVDVEAIRKKLHMTRQEFCEEFGFSIRTVEKWERGERVPESPSRAYLSVISAEPELVQRALRK